MKAQGTAAARADRMGRLLAAFVALAVVATLLLAPHAAESGRSGAVGKSPAVTLEDIPGSTAKRVILTAKAAERLGIEMGKVSEEIVVRKQMVGGLVIPPLEKPAPPSGGGFGGFGKEAAAQEPKQARVGFGGFGAGAAVKEPKQAAFGDANKLAVVQAAQSVAPQATPSTSGEVWVLVTLSRAEWDRLAKDKPARLLPLGTRDQLQHELRALPSAMPPLEDMKRSMLTLYYVVPGNDHGLTVNSRMRVELQLAGSDEKQKVLPYGAVYYDGKGVSWVYVNTKPLVFERQRIGIERVVGDVAVLSAGPPVGTPVVTVGAALLYGAEIFGK